MVQEVKVNLPNGTQVAKKRKVGIIAITYSMQNISTLKIPKLFPTFLSHKAKSGKTLNNFQYNFNIKISEAIFNYATFTSC